MPDKKPRSKNERVAAGTLLLLSKKAKRKLVDDVDEAVNSANAHLAQDPDRGHVLRVMVAAGALLGARAGVTIARGRREARLAGQNRAFKELSAFGLPFPPQYASGFLERAWEDEVHALTSAQSLAGQWQAMATQAALRAERLERSVPASVTRTKRLMASRAERTAITEISQAYNAEHKAAVEEAAKKYPALRDRKRRWSCMLDACADCASHDGEEVGIDESFSGGDEPGHVHVRGACSAEYV